MPPPPFTPQGAYYSQAPQMQQHEIGRLRQFIMELEFQQNNLASYLNLLATRITTPEAQLQYVQLLSQYNQNKSTLDQQVMILQQMLSLVPMDSGRAISDQVKREVYHLYHASRYTREALAAQYGISQSSVQRIATGPAPLPLGNVNTASLG